LSQAAPAGGITVALSDDNTALIEPASVTIAAGSTTGSFAVTGNKVSTNQTVTITASLNGSSATAAVTVTKHH
jgi:trimeric autotransporter adhesin